MPTNELIAVMHLTIGKYNVYMPSLEDVLDIPEDDPHRSWKVMAASVGVPFGEFRKWPLIDVMQIAHKMGAAIQVLNTYQTKEKK